MEVLHGLPSPNELWSDATNPEVSYNEIGLLGSKCAFQLLGTDE